MLLEAFVTKLNRELAGLELVLEILSIFFLRANEFSRLSSRKLL